MVDWAVPLSPAAATAGRQPRSPATKFGVTGAERPPGTVAGNDVIAMAEVVFYFFPIIIRINKK